MEYTTNYHLPQWVESDRIMMGDFNQMCSDMEAGLTSNAQAAAAAQAAAGNAQNAAENAQASADADQAEAAKLPYVVGSYTGTGSNVTITLGFRPSFVLICGHLATDALNTDKNILYAFGATGGHVVSTKIQITDTGFIARDRTEDLYPDFSFSGRTYDYIAFR